MSDHAIHADEHASHDHHHHEMPTEGRELTAVSVSATLHCLTGCALGEIAGMAIGTALGFSNFATVMLAVALAFVFGYTLTSIPLLRAGLPLKRVIPVALASDTFSIATMEVVDNVVMVTIPGAMHAGLGDLLFWGSLSFALAVAFVAAVPVNRWLISKGKGHVAVHETGIHGGPSPRLVGIVLSVAAIFGTAVLVAEAITGEDEMHGGHEQVAEAGHGAHDEAAQEARGLTSSAHGLTIELGNSELPREARSELSFEVTEEGEPVTDFETEHARKMHVIVARQDLTGFQHLHPEMSADGTWTTPVTLPDAGEYRVFADFNHDGEDVTLGADVTVPGTADYEELELPYTEVNIGDGYEVGIEGEAPVAGEPSEMTFNVFKGGRRVEVEPYLGADGHLVALREGDLAFLHVHPADHEDSGEHTGVSQHEEEVRFMTDFPSAGNYRLYFQFKHGGDVHTAEFTREAVEPAG